MPRPVNYPELLDRQIQGGKLTPVVGTVQIDSGDVTLDGGEAAVRFIDGDNVVYGPDHINNKLRVSSHPYLIDVAKGYIPDREIVRAYGHNEDVGIAWETVYDADQLKPWLAAAERLQIASSDAADDGAPAGNGARTITVYGLDTNYAPISETVTMNGVANVLTDASFLRVSQLEVTTAGDTGYNEGEITASNNADTAILAQMDIMENLSHGAYYTVPTGRTLYIIHSVASEASTKGSAFTLWYRELDGLWRMEQNLMVALDSATPLPFPSPIIYPAKTDIEIRARAVLAGAVVAAGFEGWIES